MKRILILSALALCIFAASAQTDSKVNIKTYVSSYMYSDSNSPLHEPDSYIGDNGFRYPQKEFEYYPQYKNLTPGQLLQESAKLNNEAIAVGIVLPVFGTFIACAPLMNIGYVDNIDIDRKICLGVGCGIAAVGLVTSATLFAISNKLLKEAGLKMERIQVSANGVTINL